VREVLTELGLPYVARQVEAWPDERDELRAVAGSDQIPLLQTEDGTLYRGTREIFAYLLGRPSWPHAPAHRRRFHDHRDARQTDVPGQLIEYFRGSDELEAAAGSVDEAVVVDVPAQSRYELRLDGRLIGLAAYNRRNGTLVLTHTEVDEDCSGRGFGTRLVLATLDDARRQGAHVVPLCPFVAHVIGEHPEYRDLVAAGYYDS
jgi:predicted GNAT family acetyltransferase